MNSSRLSPERLSAFAQPGKAGKAGDYEHQSETAISCVAHWRRPASAPRHRLLPRRKPETRLRHCCPPMRRAQHYRSLKQSSYDRTGGNRDSWTFPPAVPRRFSSPKAPARSATSGFTIAARSDHHLKELVLRAYWDGNVKPSVETPIGDFFGLNLDDYRFTNHATSPARPANRSTAISPCPTAAAPGSP